MSLGISPPERSKQGSPVCHHPFDSFRHRVQHARKCGDLYFASLISKEMIESIFGEATSILSSARVYNTSVTLWAFLSQAMSIHHGCGSAVLLIALWSRFPPVGIR